MHQLHPALNDQVNPLSLETLQWVSSSGKRGSDGGWPSREQRLGPGSCLLGFLLIQLIRPRDLAKLSSAESMKGEPRQFGLRRQNLIWAVGANCFHMRQHILSLSEEVPLDLRDLCVLVPACLPVTAIPIPGY